MKNLDIIPPPHLLEIGDASALSLHKKQSSTYIKYACGCFLYAPSICIVYFQKAFFRNIQHIYCVASLTGCQWFHTISSFSFMKNSKFRNVHGWIFLNDGIRAADENPRRIKISINGCKNINSG